MTCPACSGEMVAHPLPTRVGGSITVDVCLACHLFWFDAHESLQLSPGATLGLFRLIGEQTTPRSAEARSGATVPACPRCHIRLLETHDQQRNTRFQYRRCPRNHGRLISFVEFLREKDFIRPLSADQIAELGRNVQMVRCSNCGGPIDLAATSACAHCGSPLSMLDLQQAGALVATLQEADAPKSIDPTLPLRLERARREVEQAFAAFKDQPGWFDEVSEGGLVGAGLTAVARWLKSRA
jgi:hypothetical protein